MIEKTRRVPLLGERGSKDALNAETPLAQQDSLITPTDAFFVRRNFPIPKINKDFWQLHIRGQVENEVSLSLDDIQQMFPRKELVVTIECAGNGRSFLEEKVSGEQWGFGAVSTAKFAGAPLLDVLDSVGLETSAQYLVFSGTDKGTVADKTMNYARRMDIDDVKNHKDILVAYEMNGDTLTLEHGYPVRLVVPGWYGMAHVKGLASIDAVTQKPYLYFNDERYITPGSNGESVPVKEMQPRSLIISPQEGTIFTRGQQTIKGIAWSAQRVESVEVSTNNGQDWEEAELIGESHRYAGRLWQKQWNAKPGAFNLLSRVKDSTGKEQPEKGVKNPLGYENNGWSMQKISGRVI